MYQRPRQCRLQALALREALRLAVGEISHFQQLDHLCGTLLAVGAGEAVQLGKVVDVLARGQMRVDARAMRQHAHAAPRRE